MKLTNDTAIAGDSNTFKRAPNGDEQVITVNVTATFLLALLLLPTLSRTASTHAIDPVLTLVSSDTHAWTDFPERHHLPSNPSQATSKTPLFDALNDEAKSSMQDRYPVSKLLGVFAVRSICAERPASTGADSAPPPPHAVIVNLANPGFCHSSLSRDLDSWGFWAMQAVLGRKTEVGSRCLVDAAFKGRASHGQFLYDCAVTEPGPLVLGTVPTDSERGRGVQGERLQMQVWEELKYKLEAIEPGVTRNVQAR